MLERIVRSFKNKIIPSTQIKEIQKIYLNIDFKKICKIQIKTSPKL